ncbi:MAG: hypothetical protein GC161_08330 [Planctomycetaceae bacterium]|nr:hypothetical protein [Planctomycetaceae bacterium]
MTPTLPAAAAPTPHSDAHRHAPGQALGRPLGPLPPLLEHIENNVHGEIQRELPRLMAMAHKVERLHATCADAPHGLHAHLETLFESLRSHIEKEQQVLFPLLRSGYGSRAHMPVHILREEHREHREALERTRALCADFVAPAQACGMWRALYEGLEALERTMLDSIAVENQVLFPRVLRG